MYLDQIRNLRRIIVKEVTLPQNRTDQEPAMIELINDVPNTLKDALDLQHGYTYSKFKRYQDIYIFSDFTYNRSLGRVIVIKDG